MRRLNTDNSSTQQGMTLVETLVAVVVFSIVFLAALGLYQVANRAYLATDAATIQQQNARFAMDRVSETLRDAGANYNTTGKSLVADEQIEGAWESAVFVRGDYDNSPEPALQSNPDFPIVSTGNDEIVGYVLRKDGAGSIGIDIHADMSVGRNAKKTGTNTTTGEENPRVMVAATNLGGQTDPPYQLARVTFNDAGDAQYQVIAENIFRLSFKYMNAAGAEIISNATASGSGDNERDERALIRKIGVSIITMADRPDLGYTDPKTYTTDAFGHTAPAAAASTRNRRKFTLTEEIFGISLGRRGARHNAVPAININPPAALTVCTGHHLSYYLTWPVSTTPGIATYQVSITRGSPAVTFTVLVPTNEYRYKQTSTTVEPYTFRVAGAAGTAIGATYSPIVTKTANHEAPSIPSIPANVQAVPAPGTNALKVTWDPVTTNTGPIANATCTTEGTGAGTSVPPAPWKSEAVDLASHQVFRGHVAKVPGGTFNTSNGGVRVDGQTVGGITNVATTPINSFIDSSAAPCARYYYRVKSVDSENRIATGDGSTAMGATAAYIPDAGITPAKPAMPGPTGAVVNADGFYTFQLGWSAVTRDSADTPAATAHYEILRQQNVGGTGWTDLTSEHVYESLVLNQVVPSKSGTTDIEYRYAVKAIYDCGALGDSDRPNTSDWYVLTCTPDPANTITITTPANGSSISHPYETVIDPAVTTTGTDWTAVEISIAGPDGTPVSGYPQTITGDPDTWDFQTWDSESYPNGTYTMTVTGTAGQCRSNPVVSRFRIETGTCGLSISSPSWTSTNGSNAFRGLQFRLQNNCDLTDLTLNGLQLTWSGTVTTPNPHITGITYNGISYAASLNATSGAMGTTITFSGSQTAVIAKSGTSHQFVINFSDNMTSNLDDKNGTPYAFTSIIAKVTAPETSDEQTIDSPPLNP